MGSYVAAIKSVLKSAAMPTGLSASSSDVVITPRQVKFDWQQSVLHWLPNDAFASHIINEFSYLLQAGEFFFCRTFSQALPQVTDERLKADVQAFIRQEAIHARAHEVSIHQYLNTHGIDLAPFDRQNHWLFSHALGNDPFGRPLPAALQKQWLILRVGVIAAVEHFTCAFGVYGLESSGWSREGVDPMVVDLFRWHGAEEIEHRTVAFDLYRHLGGNLPTRAVLMLVVVPILLGLIAQGTADMIAQDEHYPGTRTRAWQPRFWRNWMASARRDNFVSPFWFIGHAMRFMHPNYHPLHEASTEQALAYIHASPNVLV